MVYLVTFFMSLIFIKIADIFKGLKILFWIFTLLGLLIPVYLASARDTSVGFDVKYYVEPFFDIACKSKTFSEYVDDVKSDYVYMGINYIVSRFTKDLFWLHFTLQSLMISMIYYVAYQYRKKFPIWIVIFLYFTIMYCTTYNIVRQSLAVAITFLGYYFFINNKRKLFFTLMILALLSHPTSIVCLLYLSVDYIVKIKNSRLKYFTIIFLSISFVGILFLFKDMINLLLTLGGDNVQRYSYYIENTEGGISKFDVALKIFTLIIIIYGLVKKVTDERLLLSFLMLTFLGIITVFLNLIATSANRFTFYFQDISFIAIPMILYSKKILIHIRLVLTLLYISLALTTFYTVFVINGKTAGYIYPYKSKILGI